MSGTLKDLLAAANATVPRLTPAQVREQLAGNAVLLDVRDPNEVAASGKIAGAVAVSRGMLEFRADPDSPAHLPALQRERTVVLYCGSGGRAALSGATLQALGFRHVFNAGGFKDLVDGGLTTEPA